MLHEIVHEPAGAVAGTIVLTHGAGSNLDAPLLKAVAVEFCERGLRAVRVNLQYRRTRPAGAPSPATAPADRATLAEALDRFRTLGPVYVGGHSYGGRQASMLLAERPAMAAGLLLMSYPLHPPGRPQQLRIEHLPRIEAPAMFVHGDRDPFGTIEELAHHIAVIPGRTRLVEATHAGHELARKAAIPRMAAQIATEFLAFLAEAD